jgi:hypothetical protein
MSAGLGATILMEDIIMSGIVVQQSIVTGNRFFANNQSKFKRRVVPLELAALNRYEFLPISSFLDLKYPSPWTAEHGVILVGFHIYASIYRSYTTHQMNIGKATRTAKEISYDFSNSMALINPSSNECKPS